MTHGRVLSIPSELIPSLKKRMDKKVIVSASGCIEWAGFVGAEGYGVIGVTLNGKVRNLAAHRLSWMVNKGPIPDDRVLDHLCRVRKCVNVEHLEPITDVENTNRGHRSRRGLPPTPARPGWVDEKLWKAAKTRAAAEGADLADIIRARLVEYVETGQ